MRFRSTVNVNSFQESCFRPTDESGFAIGSLDLAGEMIDVIDFEKAIARTSGCYSESIRTVEALQ